MMKTKIFITWLAFLLGTLTTLHAQQSLVVIGEVKNIEEETVFNLSETDGTGLSGRYSIEEDNGKVINGRFQLNYKSYNPASRHFALYSNSPHFGGHWTALDIWAEQGDTVYVKGNDNFIGNWEVKTRAPEQKEWDLIRKATAKEYKAFQQAWLDYEAYRQYRRDTEMSEAEWDSTKVILAQKDTLRIKNRTLWFKSQLIAMKELPVTDFWMDKLSTLIYFASNNREMLEEPIKELYMLKGDKIDRKPDGKSVREWVYPYPKAELGKPCVDSDFFDVNGKKYRIADFRGKYVLLDFWANYCGACIEAFPHIGKLQQQYADQLTVISISVDKIDTWKNSPHQKEITWHSLNDGGGHWGGIAGSYDIMAMPTYILISPDGTYQARLTSADIYNGNLEKQMKK
jgi:thiol-disulfide isomerase/thioredoxin